MEYLISMEVIFLFIKKVLDDTGKQVQKMLETKKYGIFLNFQKQAEKEFKILIKETESLVKAKPTGTNFKKFKTIADKMMTYWCLGFLLSEAIDPVLMERTFATGIGQSDVQDLIPKISSMVLDQKKDLERLYKELKSRKLEKILGKQSDKLIEKIEGDKKLSKIFNSHLDKYGWIEMINYIGNPLTLERILNQMSSSIESFGKKKKIKNNTKISSEIKNLLKISSCISYVRQAGAEYSSVLHFKLLRFLKDSAKELGLSYRQMLNLTSEEVIAGLNAKNKGYLNKTVQKRKDYNWLAFEDPKTKKIIVSDDKTALGKIQNKMVPKSEGTGDLVGQIGNKGKAKGTARVIMAIDDFSKFQDGDILVTTMTTPDFVILMQKSLAIVTDIGGLLCHAAIISREMNKPCVIGTKFATQKIKDGDIVEVDADAGTVKLIK